MDKSKQSSERLTKLMEKYGNATVSVVHKDVVLPHLSKGFTCRNDAQVRIANVVYPLRSIISNSAEEKLRAQAELDPTYKQIVMYVLVKNKSGDIFTTKRIGGDTRLIGGHSIGTGGHVDGGEDIFSAMYRELKEEVGLSVEDIFTTQFNGYIYDDSTEVNSVHLGLVFTTTPIDAEKVRVKEPEKLEGRWMSPHEIKALRDSDQLESWSQIAFDKVVADG